MVGVDVVKGTAAAVPSMERSISLVELEVRMLAAASKCCCFAALDERHLRLELAVRSTGRVLVELEVCRPTDSVVVDEQALVREATASGIDPTNILAQSTARDRWIVAGSLAEVLVVC